MALDSRRNQQHLPHKTQAPQRLAGPLPDRHLVSFGCGIFRRRPGKFVEPPRWGGVHITVSPATTWALARSRQWLWIDGKFHIIYPLSSNKDGDVRFKYEARAPAGSLICCGCQKYHCTYSGLIVPIWPGFPQGFWPLLTKKNNWTLEKMDRNQLPQGRHRQAAKMHDRTKHLGLQNEDVD
jgi:hypothetical protein